MFAENWARLLPAGVIEVAEALTASMADVLTVPSTATVTLTHGDMRPENLFFFDHEANRRVVLIDWQRAEIRPGAWDLANFVVLSMSLEDRRSSESGLLKEYHKRLLSQGVSGYSLEELRADYRRGLLTPLIRSIPAAAQMNPNSPGLEELAEKVFAKFAALTDWDCGDLF